MTRQWDASIKHMTDPRDASIREMVDDIMQKRAKPDLIRLDVTPEEALLIHDALAAVTPPDPDGGDTLRLSNKVALLTPDFLKRSVDDMWKRIWNMQKVANDIHSEPQGRG